MNIKIRGDRSGYDPKQAGQPVQTFAIFYDETTGSDDTLLGGAGNDQFYLEAA